MFVQNFFAATLVQQCRVRTIESLMARAPYGHAVIFHEHQQVETEMLRYEDEYDLQNSHGSMESQRIRELEERIARGAVEFCRSRCRSGASRTLNRDGVG